MSSSLKNCVSYGFINTVFSAADWTAPHALTRTAPKHRKNDEDPVFLAENLKSLNSDIDRIDLVQRFAEKHNLPVFSQIECLGKISKSDEKCVRLRQLGHDKFKAKEFFEAHQLFTESIANGHAGTENLGIAYAYRSAVLFEKGFYKECIEDIERALNNNYPEDMKEKLTTRREKAQNAIQNPAEYHLPVPKLQHPNSLIPCASESVKIKNDEKFGRYVVATRDIKAGEILSVEKPFAQIVHPTNQYLHCHECLELCYNLVPCENCRTALYCSDNCKKTANMSYHQYECDLFQLDFVELLSLRVVLKGLKDYKAMKKSDKDDVYRSDRYNEIYDLLINSQKRNPRDIFEAANEAYLYYYYFKNFSDLFREFDIDNSETVFKELIYRHHLSTSCNKIFVDKLRKNKTNTDFDKVGEALYSFTSLFNHACDPNLTLVFYGSTAVARAIKDIKEGDQCLLNYRNYNFAEYSKQERYFALSTKYFFKCECEACDNNWAVFNKLHVGDTEQYLAFTKKIEEAVENSTIFDKETINSLLNEGLRLASTMEEPDREPTKVLVNLRRLICEFVKLSGNRLLEF